MKEWKNTAWNEIREEYVTGGLPLSALAKKHGVNLNTVKYHAAKEAWCEKRREYRASRPLPQPVYANRGLFGAPVEVGPEGAGESPAEAWPPSPGSVPEELFDLGRRMLRQIDDMTRRCGTVYEMRAAVSVLRDLADILHRIPIDTEEQRARIDRIRAQTKKMEPRPQEPIEIRFIGDTENCSY